MRRHALCYAAFCALTFALPTGAALAEDAALLVCTFEGDITPDEQARLISTIEEGLSSSGTMSLLKLSSVKARLGAMAPEATDCVEPTCLERAGQALETTRGYAFTVRRTAPESFAVEGTVYDLNSTKKLKRTADGCENCTLDVAMGTTREVASSLIVSVAHNPDTAHDEPPLDRIPTGDPVKLPILGVFTNPVDTQITIDGAPAGKGRFEAPLGTGTHTVKLERKGYRTVEEQVTLVEGGTATYLIIHLRDAEYSGPVSSRSGGWMEGIDTQILGWSLASGGVLLFTAGSILLAFDGEPLCTGPVQACPDVFETTAGGATLVALGGVALSAGIISILWDQFAGPEVVNEATDVGVSFSPDGAGLWMKTRF